MAHDVQTQVSRYVSDQLNLVNSFDTWHGKLSGFYMKGFYI